MATLDVFADKQLLCEGIATRLIDEIAQAQTRQEIVNLVLTGGSVGSQIWAAVIADPCRDTVDWSRVEFWWGDERYLPAGDPDRNDVQNDAAGLTQLPVDPARVHRVLGPDASESAEASAAAYSQDLRASGGGAFDITLLGVGPDGHVASLFPGHPAAPTTDAIAIAVHDSPKPPPVRVSLTFEALTRSRQVWFVVAGADKAEAVELGLRGEDTPPEVSSAAQVQGMDRTVWMVDEAAAANVT